MSSREQAVYALLRSLVTVCNHDCSSMLEHTFSLREKRDSVPLAPPPAVCGPPRLIPVVRTSLQCQRWSRSFL
jgi:hypothetical protein